MIPASYTGFKMRKRITSDDESSTTSRRSVLKAAGATAAVGLASAAASGTAGAQDVKQPVAADRAAAETVFDWHAGELIDDLVADGVIADRSALSLEPGDFGAMVADRDGAAVVRDRDSGVHEVRTVQQVGGGELSVTVEAETGRAYALFYPAGTDERRLYNPDVGARGDDVGTLSHDCTCRCSSLVCEWPYESEECECCDSVTGECHTDFYCRC